MRNPLMTVAKQKSFGVIHFDRQLQVVDIDAIAQRLLGSTNQTPSGSITDILPELVGAERQMERIVAKQEDCYRLDLLNRLDGEGDLRYINLLILPGNDGDRAVMLIEDATREGQILQAANQQRYDLYLESADITQTL
jgi:hypothetical protein